MKTIKGIIPPMITPLKGDDQIDREGTVRLTEHILAGGVHALFLLGTTGEAQSLSYVPLSVNSYIFPCDSLFCLFPL